MAQLSGIVTSFESVLKDFILKGGGIFDWSKPQYSITRLGQGQYDITLSLSGLGVQHVYMSVVGDELTIRGKIALIGSNSSFPLSIVQDLVNQTVQTWLEKGLDSFSTQTPGTVIQLVQSMPLMVENKPVATVPAWVPPEIVKKPVMKTLKAVVKGQ